MERLSRNWKRVPRRIRQPLILLVGCIVIAAGLVMLITPGPGWAALFLGFAILATEFAFAERVRDRMIAFLKRLIAHGQRLWHKIIRH